MNSRSNRPDSSQPRVRYAVVGLGHIAQAAVLPAFSHARRHSELTALVSDDPVKLQELAARYGIKHTYTYDEYQECLESDVVDAVYLAVPNNLHRSFGVAAAEAGRHVLCEKPLTVTPEAAENLVRAAQECQVRLMTAYRLHFNAGNLAAIETLQKAQIGEPRFFGSHFGMQVQNENIRLESRKGGGPLYDLGVYCINAARYLFQAEPIEVSAFCAASADVRFREVEEMASGLIRFPGNRLATFTCSFGSADVAWFEVVGTHGSVRLDQAYEYQSRMTLEVNSGGRRRRRSFPKTDQFAAELEYFSQCVLEGRDPEPSGVEGWMDVEIIDALHRSAASGRSVPVCSPAWDPAPSVEQRYSFPALSRSPSLVRAQSASRS